MNSIIKQIRSRAKAASQHIVLPESNDVRVLKAASYLSHERLCAVTLIGDEDQIRETAQQNSIVLGDEIEFTGSISPSLEEELSTHLYKRRKHKGMSLEDAVSILDNPLYLAACLVATDKAAGCVAGSVATTGEMIRAAIHGIGLRKGIETISSTFLMALTDGRVLTYADCGVVPYPDKQQLADIAIESARTHERLTQQAPVVAMLSFSTKGSAYHDKTQLVIDALEIAQEKAPGLNIDGELQFDAAFVPEVGQRKAPASKVAGKANVFIFPNLDAGNIAYKITERLAGAAATGPILQGLAKPMMDLSRGCNWQDIVNAACVSVLMGESA